MSAIRRLAREIAERFKPEKIILFGSYAYGQPHEESDVDLMVIMPTRNAIDQAIRIDLAFERQFSLDVHVRTPYQIKRGLKQGDCDWFLREVMEKGKVLYEASHGAVGEQGRRGRGRSHGNRPRKSRLEETSPASIVNKRRRSTSRRSSKNSAPPCQGRMISVRYSQLCASGRTQACS